MAKQKVVIKVSMNDQKSRKKALKTVVGCIGVESTALQGKDKDQIEVVGEGIDAVEITTLLRKNVGYSEIVSVSAVPEKKEDKKEDKKDDPKPTEVVWATHPFIHHGVPPYQHFVEFRDPNPDPCTIM
ncbi:OLC1v1023491C1 [Oldenlandia corymbosa var. corymbosa]|uniref:OLC1v1023491C1 n=1 Tax=Oldenlandia corymbosa var. corymbosa TaxID=529605 RepID=A0AAV1C016_OLDCO|nr:OLC1v1023491C1 [Oldenlandia corymbosa var. corymbosa]